MHWNIDLRLQVFWFLITLYCKNKITESIWSLVQHCSCCGQRWLKYNCTAILFNRGPSIAGWWRAQTHTTNSTTLLLHGLQSCRVQLWAKPPRETILSGILPTCVASIQHGLKKTNDCIRVHPDKNTLDVNWHAHPITASLPTIHLYQHASSSFWSCSFLHTYSHRANTPLPMILTGRTPPTYQRAPWQHQMNIGRKHVLAL